MIEDQPDLIHFEANQGEGKNLGDDRGMGGFDTVKNPANENFTYHGLTNNYGVAEKFGKLRQHLIYLSELKDILTQGATLVLVKHNQEIEKFMFSSEEQVKTFARQLVINQGDFLKIKNPLNEVDIKADIRKRVPFLNWPQDAQNNTCFKLKIGVVNGESSFLKNSFIELDQQNIYEVDGVSGMPRRQAPLASLEYMRIIDDNPEFNLILTFSDDIQMILNAASFQDRERLIACTMTLRGFALAKL